MKTAWFEKVGSVPKISVTFNVLILPPQVCVGLQFAPSHRISHQIFLFTPLMLHVAPISASLILMTLTISCDGLLLPLPYVQALFSAFYALKRTQSSFSSQKMKFVMKNTLAGIFHQHLKRG